MKPASPLKHFAIAFAIAVLLYAVAYHFIENRRTRNGPWIVTFSHEAASAAVTINERKLNIADVKLVFTGEPAPATNTTVFFAQPKQVPFDVPFGQCLFEDTTFQPGTIVFKLFGHEVQLMPRVLTIDKHEYVWQSGQTIALKKIGAGEIPTKK